MRAEVGETLPEGAELSTGVGALDERPAGHGDTSLAGVPQPTVTVKDAAEG